MARRLIGTPYRELDCINLIKKVIREAPGGVKGYTTAGTNALWNSYDMSAKYKDLSWRQDGLDGVKAGMIAFKATGSNFHHAGIATGQGTVIHSSSTQGGRGVVETPLTAAQGWTHVAVHRYIEAADDAVESGDIGMAAYLYRARVVLKDEDSTLNVRKEPGGAVIDRLNHGAIVEVREEKGEWALVRYGDRSSGYVSMKYIAEKEEEEHVSDDVSEGVLEHMKEWTSLINAYGEAIILKGDWRVAQD